MNEHEVLETMLNQLVEQPEPSTEGNWFCVDTRDLAANYKYIEFHFNDETGKLDMARLTKDDEPEVGFRGPAFDEPI